MTNLPLSQDSPFLARNQRLRSLEEYVGSDRSLQVSLVYLFSDIDTFELIRK
jgi:hypothetical protein